MDEMIDEDFLFINQSSRKMYRYFCIIRIFFIFYPLLGYIHPDEHFQGPEIVYGDILNLTVHRTWEFANRSPVRSIATPYLINSFPAFLVKFLQLVSNPISTAAMMIFSRSVMCGLSFLNDVLIHKICLILKKDSRAPLAIFSSSYVTLSYLTRTFSNSLEVLYFSFLLFLLSKFIHVYVQHIARKQKYTDEVLWLVTKLGYAFGIVLSAGVYNRPSFVCYAAFPACAFAYTLLKMKKMRRQCACAVVLASASVAVTMTSLDALYYNETHYSSVGDVFRHIPITPLNFFVYNMNTDHLEEHGLHPLWLHSCVNVPLLFSTYGVLVMLDFIRCLLGFTKWPFLLYRYLFIATFMCPLMLLSTVPHQEPRFLLPLIIPISVLCNEPFYLKFVHHPKVQALWFVHCCMGALFFGLFHQGGVISSTSFIRHSLRHHNTSSRTVVVYYKTYMPPSYLHAITGSHVRLCDFGGIQLEALESEINGIVDTGPDEIFVVVPWEMADFVRKMSSLRASYATAKSLRLFPHVATENLPRIEDFQNIVNRNATARQKFSGLLDMFCIHILTFRDKT